MAHPIRIETFDWREAPAEIPRQTLAIGDIHGRADLLSALHAEIKRIARAEALVVHIGDYIDRGPQSMESLRPALDGVAGIETRCLPGNHEQFLCAALGTSSTDQFEIMDIWLDNGGRAVADELGCHGSAADPAYRARLLDRIRTALGTDRLLQLEALDNHMLLGGYIFVHAGLNPEIPIAEFLSHPWHTLPTDEDRDPLWVRWPFTGYDGFFERNLIVVHGHTPKDEPEILNNRINTDTRAYDSGRLTAIEFEGRRLRIIQAVGDPKQRIGAGGNPPASTGDPMDRVVTDERGNQFRPTLKVRIDNFSRRILGLHIAAPGPSDHS